MSIPSLLVSDCICAVIHTAEALPGARFGPGKRTFSYRLNGARRVVENSFGILAARFGIYQTMITQAPDKAKKFVLASLALHNFLQENKDLRFCGQGAVDVGDAENGEWKATPTAHLSFHFVYSPVDQYRPSQDCHLFNFTQLFQFHLYLVIGKLCQDDASYFMFFFRLVFLTLNVFVEFCLFHKFQD